MGRQSNSGFQYRKEKVMEVTIQAAAVVDELVFYYGHLSEGDPEREILKSKISEVLADWSETIRSYGAVPMDLWTVTMKAAEETWEWQYPCSSFIESRHRPKSRIPTQP